MLGHLGSCEDREKRTVCSNPPETFETKAMVCSSLKIVGLVKGQGKSEDTALDFQTPPPRLENILWEEKGGHEISCCGT